MGPSGAGGRAGQSTAALAEDPGGEAALWADIESEGTPLIEPIEGAPQDYWVTFL
ncbi:MAG: hypothetical protein VYE73_18195 [Acidobacteriota bacterium]|nr:hypothetical protein [Acidobacteriota bacterium]